MLCCAVHCCRSGNHRLLRYYHSMLLLLKRLHVQTKTLIFSPAEQAVQYLTVSVWWKTGKRGPQTSSWYYYFLFYEHRNDSLMVSELRLKYLSNNWRKCRRIFWLLISFMNHRLFLWYFFDGVYWKSFHYILMLSSGWRKSMLVLPFSSSTIIKSTFRCFTYLIMWNIDYD